MLAAIDAGRAYVKYVGPNGVQGKFRSWIYPYYETQMEVIRSPKDVVLEYNDRKWYVGDVVRYVSDLGQGENMQEDKTGEHTVIFILTALALMGANDCEDITLITGLPLDQYRKNKDRIRERLEGTHTIRITTGDMEDKRVLVIKKVGVAVEGAGAFYANPRNGTVRVLDVGSRTVNALSFYNKRYIDPESYTFNYGWDSVKEENRTPEHFADRLNASLGRKWKPDDPILVAGGKAEELAGALRKYYPNAEAIPDAQMANAIGFWRMGERVG